MRFEKDNLLGPLKVSICSMCFVTPILMSVTLCCPDNGNLPVPSRVQSLGKSSLTDTPWQRPRTGHGDCPGGAAWSRSPTTPAP